MTSAYVSDRAAEIVSAGWVKVLARQQDGRVLARVRGYRVVRSARGTFRCDCPAGYYGAECSHSEALRIVIEAADGEH